MYHAHLRGIKSLRKLCHIIENGIQQYGVGELLYCASLTKAARDLDISIRVDRLRLRAA
jgi:hypothetical protein